MLDITKACFCVVILNVKKMQLFVQWEDAFANKSIKDALLLKLIVFWRNIKLKFKMRKNLLKK